MERVRKKPRRTPIRRGPRPTQEGPPVPRFLERMIVKHCADPLLKHRAAAISKVDEQRRLVDFIASTAEVDRDGEVVVTRGIDTTSFRLNPTFLLDHDRRSPIGRVTALAVERLGDHDGLVGTAEILPAGTSQRVDEAWGEIRAGARNGISIGFLPVDVDPPGTRGRILRRTELLEISSVTMPSCRACVVIGTSGAKALADQAALVEAIQRTLHRGEQLQAKLLAGEFGQLRERAQRPHGYKLLDVPRDDPKRGWAVKALGVAAEALGISSLKGIVSDVKFFAEERERPDFRSEKKLWGGIFPDGVIGLCHDLSPAEMAETASHELLHVVRPGATEKECDDFGARVAAKLLADEPSWSASGSAGVKSGRPMPGDHDYGADYYAKDGMQPNALLYREKTSVEWERTVAMAQALRQLGCV